MQAKARFQAGQTWRRALAIWRDLRKLKPAVLEPIPRAGLMLAFKCVTFVD